MNESKKGTDKLSDIPEAEVRTGKRHFSIVWLVPLVAVIIGGWLVYKAISEKGPTIHITLASAEGLEAGKTKIKYKDVELGQVNTIELSDDLSQVIVTAEMVTQAEKFISENTRFWVVRARVGATGVSGLGTLFSGAYIALDPGKPGKPAQKFKGLEVPPVVTTDLPGRHIVLEAPKRGSLEVGSPVYYRQINVGQVVAYKIAEDGQSVTFEAFINAPYDKFVYPQTRFWNASGIDVNLSAEGIRVNTESLASIIVGGISFKLPPDVVPTKPAKDRAIYTLYQSVEAAMQETYADKNRWTLFFNESVRGLSVGAPVEMYGVKVGQVLDVKLEADWDSLKMRIAVDIEIEPARAQKVGQELEGAESLRMRSDLMVNTGMRAQLKTGSLLTGQQLIAIDYFPDAEPAEIDWEHLPYPVWPSIPTTMEGLTNKITRIVEKIDNLPLEQIGNDLRDTIGNTKKLTASPEITAAVRNLNAALHETQLLITDLRTELTPAISATLEQAQQSLAGAENILNADSSLQVDLKMTLDEISGAARSLRLLLDYLERHPESLLRGKGTEK